MKKILVAFVALLTVSNVSADLCTAELKQQDRYSSYVIQRFVKFDFNEMKACNEALRDCRQEMRERRQWDRNANLTCELEGNRNGNGNRLCSYDLETRNGRVIDTFGRRSCKAAEDACMRDLIQRNRNGRNLRARCVQSRGNTNPGNQVTRTCTVERRGARGNVMTTHLGQATGRRGTGVKAKACQKAMRQCQSYASNRQYCTQR